MGRRGNTPHTPYIYLPQTFSGASSYRVVRICWNAECRRDWAWQADAEMEANVKLKLQYPCLVPAHSVTLWYVSGSGYRGGEMSWLHTSVVSCTNTAKTLSQTNNRSSRDKQYGNVKKKKKESKYVLFFCSSSTTYKHINAHAEHSSDYDEYMKIKWETKTLWCYFTHNLLSVKSDPV